MNNERPELGGEGYRRILAVCPRDARLYRWSEGAALIAAVGILIASVIAVFRPLSDWFSGSFRTWLAYLGLLALLTAPFLLLLGISIFLHRRIARRYNVL